MQNNMSLVQRLQRSVRAFNRQPVDMVAVSKELDTMISNKQLATGDLPKAGDLPVENKDTPMSNRDIMHTDRNLAYVYMYNALGSFVAQMDSAPDDKNPIAPRRREDPVRDWFMSEFWKNEPILAGAVYSMTSRLMSLSWSITGKRRATQEAAKMLARSASMQGYDWGGFAASTAQDFYTTNRGVFWELAKEDQAYPLASPLVDLGHMDALCCTLTGNSLAPVIYNSIETGQTLIFHPGEYAHLVSMPSPRERFLGLGLCAVDRAYRAAKMLIGLHNYDEEKLSNLPPEGIAAITGLTTEEFNDALNLWHSKRESDDSLTFPQVLWLIGSQPNAKVEVNMSGWRQIPESFDRKTTIEQYINTVALDFGMDTTEFWTPMGGGGMGQSSSSGHLQHNKARGKGNAELTSMIERKINGELSSDADFHFGNRDQEESANEAAVAKAWVDAFLPLYNMKPISNAGGGKPGGESGPQDVGNPFKLSEYKANFNPPKRDGSPTLPVTPASRPDTGGPMGINQGQPAPTAEQIITKQQFLELLSQKGVIPDYMVNGERVVVESHEVHNYFYKEGDPDDMTVITWDHGVLKETRMSMDEIHSPSEPALPVAEHIKEESRLDSLVNELRSIKNMAEHSPTTEEQ
jgi:hypothetical protein